MLFLSSCPFAFLTLAPPLDTRPCTFTGRADLAPLSMQSMPLHARWEGCDTGAFVMQVSEGRAAAQAGAARRPQER